MRIIAAKKIETRPNNIESDFPVWLHREITRLTNNYKKTFPLDEAEIEILTNWAYTAKPNLSSLDILTAYNQAYIWSQQQLVKQYKTNDVIYSWKDGWKMIKLPPPADQSSKNTPEENMDDVAIERELMQADGGEYRRIYDANFSYIEENKLPVGGVQLDIYSLRDPENFPRATIEIYSDKNPEEKWLHVQEVFTKEDDSKTEKNLTTYSPYVKEFFNYLKKQGYQFGTVDGGSSEDVKAERLSEISTEDQFGLPYEIWGVGGSSDNYFDSLQEAYSAGGDGGSYWYASRAKSVADDLITYAEERNELNLLEAALEGYETKTGYDATNKKPKTKFQGFNDLAWNWWEEATMDMGWEHPYPGDEPQEEDFMIEPDLNQPAIPGLSAPIPVLDKQAYEQALKEYQKALEAHEEEKNDAEKNFDPYIFQNYVYEELRKAKERKTPTKKDIKANYMKTKITKMADKIDEKLPSGEQMSLYVLTLKQYLKDNPNISEEWKDLIRQLPSPRQVRQDFSMQEIKLLYETVEYLWKKITGTKIIEDKEIIRAPESLSGNYWLLNKGILLKGINHYSIAKQNSQLICSLLDVSGMTFQEYLGSQPNKLIYFIIKNGGIRLFVTKDKRLYAQMSANTYGKWGRDKIKKLDFKLKAIKLIDLKAPFSGWSTGITVKL